VYETQQKKVGVFIKNKRR